MAYAVTNPPEVVCGNHKNRVWLYKSADAVATVDGSGYFTNGGKGTNNTANLGMQLGDPVCVVDTATPLVSWKQVTVINATTGAVTTG